MKPPPYSLRPLRRGRMPLCAAWVLACALMVSGCTTASVRTAGVRTAQEAQVAADSALAAYEALRSVSADNAYNQGYLRVVVSPEPDAVDFTAVSDAGMGDLLDARSRACRQIRTAAVHLRLLCAERAKAEALQSYAAAVESLRGLSDDATVTTEFKKLVSALPADLSAVWQSRRIARLNDTVSRATAELGTLWVRELSIWEGYVHATYIDHYASGLLSLRLANFDEKDLARKVDAPYGIPVKAGLYKLQKYREAVQAADTIKAKLRQASEAFEQTGSGLPPAKSPRTAAALKPVNQE